mgnify:CR=1 FL=1
MHLKNGICHPSNHRTSGRNPSGNGLGGRSHPPPQRSDDGDTPAPQGAPTPPARWRERETGLLGQLQRYHQQHGADTKEDVTARNIKNVNLNFQPDEAFKNDLQKATFA